MRLDHKRARMGEEEEVIGLANYTNEITGRRKPNEWILGARKSTRRR